MTKLIRPLKLYSDGRHQIENADGEVIMCNEQYYPWFDLDEDDWQEIVDALNTHGFKDEVYEGSRRNWVDRCYMAEAEVERLKEKYESKP